MRSERTRVPAMLPDSLQTVRHAPDSSAGPTVFGHPRVAEPPSFSGSFWVCPDRVWLSRRASSAALASAFPHAALELFSQGDIGSEHGNRSLTSLLQMLRATGRRSASRLLPMRQHPGTGFSMLRSNTPPRRCQRIQDALHEHRVTH